MFHRLSKHLEFRQKYSAARRISTLFSVFGYPDQTLFIVFDILHKTLESTDEFILFACAFTVSLNLEISFLDLIHMENCLYSGSRSFVHLKLKFLDALSDFVLMKTCNKMAVHVLCTCVVTLCTFLSCPLQTEQ